jgi:hypothetical protein
MKLLGELTFREAFALTQDIPELVLRLQAIGVLRSKVLCESCEQEMKMQKYSHYSEGLCWKCTDPRCGKRRTIRACSYFEKHKLPLDKLFMILYSYLKYDKMLQKYIADICGTTEKTIVEWGNYIRETISHYFLGNLLW